MKRFSRTKSSQRSQVIMSAFSGVLETSTLILFVILISSSSASPQLHTINNNLPVALLLPNGKIVVSPSRPQCDPQNLKPTLTGLKPSKGSICSLLTANFSNQRKKGFAEVLSRVHEANNGKPFRPIGYPQRAWSGCANCPRKLQKYGNMYQPIYHRDPLRSQFYKPGSQFSWTLNLPSSFSNTNRKNITFSEFNGLFNFDNQKGCCIIDQHSIAVKHSIENVDSDYENVKLRKPKVESRQAAGSINFETVSSDSPTRGQQHEQSSLCSDGGSGSMLILLEESCPPVTSNPINYPGVNEEPGNHIPKEAGSIPLLSECDKSIFDTPERISPYGGILRSGLGQCLPALRMSPENISPQAPSCVLGCKCLPIMPWMPGSPTKPRFIDPWCPRTVPPPWTPVPSCFPRTLCQPWSPIIEPLNIVFANHCSHLGPFAPPVFVTAVTDAALVYFVVLPNVLSPTTALNVFPPETLILMEPQEFAASLNIFCSH